MPGVCPRRSSGRARRVVLRATALWIRGQCVEDFASERIRGARLQHESVASDCVCLASDGCAGLCSQRHERRGSRSRVRVEPSKQVEAGRAQRQIRDDDIGMVLARAREPFVGRCCHQWMHAHEMQRDGVHRPCFIVVAHDQHDRRPRTYRLTPHGSRRD